MRIPQAEVATHALCRMVWASDLFTPNGHTRVQVLWALSVKRIDAQTCEYTNSVIAHPTAESVDFTAQRDIRFEDAAVARQHDGGDHNRRGTPLFAASIVNYRSPPRPCLTARRPRARGSAASAAALPNEGPKAAVA